LTVVFRFSWSQLFWLNFLLLRVEFKVYIEDRL
jgi:hypothetical protein